MKDIDFDELDRAVSSVLNQKRPSDDSAATSSNEPDEKTETVSVTNKTTAPVNNTPATPSTESEQTNNNDTVTATVSPDPVTTDTTDSADTSDQPETAPTVATSTSPLAVKRRGKFMDVMHPSHDMAPDSPAPAALPASKPKHLLSPVSHDLKPDETKHDTDTKSEPVSAPEPVVNKPEPQVETPADDSRDTEKKPTSLYIDPLELDDKSKDAKPDEESVETKQPSPEENTPETPQTTPFLTDAKVEKRPLGGFNEPEATTTPETSPEADSVADQPANNQTAPSVPLPRELQPDVVKVEAVHDDTRPPVSDPATNEPEAPAESKPAGDNEKTQSHPLFDTSTYHEPTAAKHSGKKPGWLMWVIGFVICLAIGGGVGYFLFTAGF